MPKKKYTYYSYTLRAPLYFGVANSLSLYIATKYNLSFRMRFLTISILTYLGITTFTYFIKKSYKFSKKEWQKYFLKQFLAYMIVWNVVIYNLEKYTSNII